MNTEDKQKMIEALRTIGDLVCVQSEFAREIGVSSSTISNWRNREHNGPDGKYGVNRAVVPDTEIDIFKGLARIGASQTLFYRSEIPRISKAYQEDGGTRNYVLSLNSSSVKSVVSALRAFGVIERGAEDSEITRVLLYILEVSDLDAEIARQNAEILAGDPVRLAQRAVAALADKVIAKSPPKAK